MMLLSLSLLVLISYVVKTEAVKNVETKKGLSSSHSTALSGHTSLPIPLMAKSNLKSFSPKDLKKTLRSTSADEAIIQEIELSMKQVDGTHVELNGFWEEVFYSDDQCHFNPNKFLIPFKKCILGAGGWWDPNTGNTNPYYSVVYGAANTHNHTWSLWTQYYLDPACQQRYGIRGIFGMPQPLHCTNKVLEWKQATLPDPAVDTFGIAFMYYTDPLSCAWTTTANMTSPQARITMADYAHFDTCYKSQTGDVKYTSCDSASGLVGTIYGSTDGSCTGIETSMVWGLGDQQCYSKQINGNYAGYVKAHCQHFQAAASHAPSETPTETPTELPTAP